jgi:hypothetical protein
MASSVDEPVDRGDGHAWCRAGKTRARQRFNKRVQKSALPHNFVLKRVTSEAVQTIYME